ncbi:hypothetical protein BD408DRAFT_470726 [Parasitella parasitica]|nr:hypothetical protein BD408DRAFT_470726 [Parasitella parasitica]
MPVHYETEHGEQYNKFIREAILLTNRHNPSKDVALKLAKQFLVRHLVNGGSFTVTKNDGSASRSRVGSSIMKWQSKIEELLDSRENSDNNDYRTPSTVQDSFVVYKTKLSNNPDSNVNN